MYTNCYESCTITTVASRLNVTLDDERSAKLGRLADRAHLNAGTLARSMLTEAIDRADAALGATEREIATAGPAAMTAILLADPTFAGRFEQGLADARDGRVTPLDELG